MSDLETNAKVGGIGAVVLAAAAAAIAITQQTGEVLPAPAGGRCFVAWGVGPCEAAELLAAEPLGCEPGTEVTLPVELVVNLDVEVQDVGGLPPGFDAIDAATSEPREVPCATLTRPARALTVVPLAKHASPAAPGEPLCPPVVIAGREPPGCGP